jgi:hypothetical protein
MVPALRRYNTFNQVRLASDDAEDRNKLAGCMLRATDPRGL